MKIAKLTLTPNRSTGPVRTSKIIVYRRYGERVHAFEVRRSNAAAESIEETPIRNIRGCQVDPEFEVAWGEHVRYQRALARE